MARQRILDRRHKVRCKARLGDISRCTFRETSADKLNPRLHRQEHNFGR